MSKILYSDIYVKTRLKFRLWLCKEYRDPLPLFRCSHEGHFINFQKKGNLGIQVAGGNSVGIFTAAVKPKSAAAKAGLKEGDLILEVTYA